jgi:VanZ family protein
LAGCAGVIVLSLMPKMGPPGDGGFDKILHFGVYAFLAWGAVLLHASAHRAYLYPVLLVIMAGALELGQVITPDRTPSISDFIASGGGALSGLIAVWYRTKRQ